MNAFKLFRLSLWAILLAGCLTISLLYAAVNQTLLSKQGLQTIVADSGLTQTVREEILLPKILQTTRASVYADLLDDETVTTAFNRAVSTETLNKKLDPAITATEQWLNNKTNTIDFSISLSDISDTFAASLAEEVNTKLAGQPRCTMRNTLSDAERGVCRSALVSAETLQQKITELVTRDQSLAANTTLTPESIRLSPTITQRGSNLPDYLNIFYAVALVSTGIALLGMLWLIGKHRIGGMITLGISGLLAALVLFVGSIVGTQAVGVLSSDSRVQQIARTGASALEGTLQQYGLGLGIVGALLCIGGVTFITIRRRRGRQTVRFGRHGE